MIVLAVVFGLVCALAATSLGWARGADDRVDPLALPEDARHRGYLAWVESSMRRVPPSGRPAEAPPSWLGVALSIARGEHESFQIVLLPLPGNSIQDVRIKTSPLLGHGGASIGQEHLTWHQVGYVQLRSPHPHPMSPELAEGWWPDPLLPVDTLHVPEGFAQSVWFTVYAPYGTPAGECRGSLTISSRHQPALQAALSVRVHDFDIPPGAGHLKTATGLFEGFLEKIHGLPRDENLRRVYSALVLQHRGNPDNISRSAPPSLEDLRYYRSLGMNSLNVRNLGEKRGERPVSIVTPPEWYTEEHKAELVAELDPYFEALRQEPDLYQMAYVYAFDEGHIFGGFDREHAGIVQQWFGMARERWRVPTMSTIGVRLDAATLKRLTIDRISLLLTARPDVSAQDGPLLSWPVGGPAYIEPYEGPDSVAVVHGDGQLIYPGVNGPIGSIRLANIRDGLEDCEYLYALSLLPGGGERAFREARGVARSFTGYARVAERRGVVAEAIETLRSQAGKVD